MLTPEVLEANIASIKGQLARLLDFEAPNNPARLVDNATWTAPVSYLDFLRDIGKHFSVNMMVAKESVRARMEDREAGISYTEFSYMLLQAFDFYHLQPGPQLRTADRRQRPMGQHHRRHRSDAARNSAAHVFGLTLPLITNADGSKFGKTVGGRRLARSRKRPASIAFISSGSAPTTGMSSAT